MTGHRARGGGTGATIWLKQPGSSIGLAHTTTKHSRKVLAGASEQVQALAGAVRDLVYDVLPLTVEVVWEKQGSVGWGTGPKKFTEQFAYLMLFKKHVTL